MRRKNLCIIPLSCDGRSYLAHVGFVRRLFQMSACALFSAITLFSISAAAQNFESDSIYYTPIPKSPKTKATVERHVSVFRDTTRTRARVAYYFDMSIGSLIGCSDCPDGTEFTLTTSMTHGITLGRKTRVGIGAGFDTYLRWKSVPVFASASYDLVGTKNTHALFVQAQYGWGFASYHAREFVGPVDQDGGIVFAALVGYRVRYHNLRIGISTGYRRQSASLLYETASWYPDEHGQWVVGSPMHRTVDVDLGRAVLNVFFSWR